MSLTVVNSDPITLIVDQGRGPVGPAGPAGPQGPSGSGGGGGTSGVDLLFTYASPSTTWTMVHGLNTYALVVETFDNNGDLVDGEVDYIDANTIQVTWYYPSNGYAHVFN